MKSLAIVFLVLSLSAAANAGVLDGLRLESAGFESSHPTGWEGSNPVSSSQGTLSNASIREESGRLTIDADVNYVGADNGAQFLDMRSVSISLDTANWNNSLTQGTAGDDGFPSHGLSPAEADGTGKIQLSSGEFSHSITCMLTVSEHPIGSYKETIQRIDCFYQVGDAGEVGKDLPDFYFTFTPRF